MQVTNLARSVILSGLFFVGMPASYAAVTDEVVCPTVDELKQFNFFYRSIGKYDQNTGKVNFSVSLIQEKNAGNNYWIFRIERMKAGKGDDLKSIFNDAIENLVPVSSEPFQYGTHPLNKKKVPVCFYTLPGNESVHASAGFYHSSFLPSLKKINNLHYFDQLINRS